MVTNNATWVYDIESYPNFFCLCAINIYTNKRVQFVLYYDEKDKAKNIDDRMNLYSWLINEDTRKVSHMIGFNNLEYDYPVIHKGIYESRNMFLNLPLDRCVKSIKLISNDVIDSNFNEIKDSDSIMQTDLFKIYHFDNKNRTCSLKKLEFIMRMEDVSDLPYPHNKNVNYEQALHLVKYCHHDVDATYEFYKRAVDEKVFEFRENIQLEYGIECRNFNDVKIGSEIFINLLAKDMKVDIHELRKKRTFVDKVDLADCIPEDVYFISKELQQVYDTMMDTTVVSTSNAFQVSCNYAGVKYDFALGGLHGKCGSGIYEPAEDEMILSADVEILRPNFVNSGKPKSKDMAILSQASLKELKVQRLSKRYAIVA